MSMTLYDPAFATLSQHAGDRYRRMVTVLTLLGGFASTVFWPISHVLVEAWGWRISLAVYAALHLLICLPVHASLIPRLVGSRDGAASTHAAVRSPAFDDPRLKWLNAGFTIATFAVGLVAVHMVGLLTTVGLTTAQAVAAAMLLGPMQVAGRIAEMAFLTRIRSPPWARCPSGDGRRRLHAGGGLGPHAPRDAFVATFGCGNGIFTMVAAPRPPSFTVRPGAGQAPGIPVARVAFRARPRPGTYSWILTLGLTQWTGPWHCWACSSQAAWLASPLRTGRHILRDGCHRSVMSPPYSRLYSKRRVSHAHFSHFRSRARGLSTRHHLRLRLRHHRAGATFPYPVYANRAETNKTTTAPA